MKGCANRKKMVKKASKRLKVINKIIIPDTPIKKCNHFFEFTRDGCYCKKCPLGLKGVLELKKGKPVL